MAAFIAVTPRGAFTASHRPSLTSSRLPRPLPTSRKSPSPSRRQLQPRCTQKTPPDMPDSAKAAAARGENVAYWQGEWICVDCGFIYKPKRRVKFEDLPASWKCPQCNAPKRRFAKKAGELIAETAGTSNTPIVVFSIVGLIATVAFGFWASTQL